MVQKRKITIAATTHSECDEEDVEIYRNMTHEQRLDLLEQLRQISGAFLYEYPTRLRRVITSS